MTVQYRFQTSAGIHEMRTRIPESTGEELRGHFYDAAMIEWLHRTEQANILARCDRMKSLFPELELGEVWTEREDGTKVQAPAFNPLESFSR